jgi:choline/ethanolamine kinase
MVAVDPPPREAAAAPPSMKRSASFDRVPEEARRILHRLAGELWGGDVDPAALAVSQLKGAMTNEVFRITWPGGGGGGEGEGEGDHRKVLVRIYGQGVEVFFDRADEVRTFECMSRHGQGPRLLGRFPNGRIEEFINARVRTLSLSLSLSPITPLLPMAMAHSPRVLLRRSPRRICATRRYPR